MNFLIDTNILVRLAQPGNDQYSFAIQALDALSQQGYRPCIVPQILYEFWVVCTRPAGENGLGFDLPRAEAELQTAKRLFRLLQDERDIYRRWERLVVLASVQGKTAHDARLVAAMQRHGITHILTFNAADFVRYTDITVMNPMTFVPPAT